MFELPLPAVVAVREGINLPRYPSVPGRLRAKKKEIERVGRSGRPGGPELIRLSLPVEQEQHVEILGTGPEAAPRVVEVMRESASCERPCSSWSSSPAVRPTG